MTQSRETVVIVIPTYNEAGNIDRVVKTLAKAIFPDLKDRYDMKILVVDDKSPDDTAGVVKRLMKSHESLHLLENPDKKGLGYAYSLGIKHAIDKLSANILFEFDADLSHDPYKIPLMLSKIEEGYDVVLGSRYIKGGSIPGNWGLHRKFLSVVGNFVIRLIITNFSVRDWTGGYRAIRSRVVKKILPQLQEDRFLGYTFQIGFLHKAIGAGFTVTEVPFHFKDRELGQSKIGSEYVRNTLRYILKVRSEELGLQRLFRFVVVGIIGAMVQLGTLWLFRISMPFQLAFFLSVEMAVVSNFIWSNLWTFADRKLPATQIPLKFLQFNLASAGSVLIQEVVAIVGQFLFGLVSVFTLPYSAFVVDTGILFAIVGIGLGTFWNYFAYSRFVWRK